MKSRPRLSILLHSLCLLAAVFASGAAFAQIATPGDPAHTKDNSSKTSSPPITYSITDLGNFSPTALNSYGQVVGSLYISPEKYHAFLWQDGKLTDLGPSPERKSLALAINDNAQIVGWAERAGGNQHAVLWQNGKMTEIDRTDDFYSEAHGINKEGQIVGFEALTSTTSRAVLWQGGQATDLGTLAGANGSYSMANAINNEGQVIGLSVRPGGTTSGAFLWQNGQMMDLGSASDQAESINDKTQVVGLAAFTSLPFGHPFLWQNGKLTDLGALTGVPLDSDAHSINNQGQVVGSSYTAATDVDQPHAFIWRDGRMTDLNTLLYAAANWTLQSANGVNDAGQIAGYGLRNGQEGGFLLTPLAPGSGNGKLSLSSSSWTFSAHAVGRTSGPGTIYLTSIGPGDLHIQQIRVGALSPTDAPDDFKIVANTCFPSGSQNLSQPLPVTLTPHESCAITFDFTPLVAGGRGADIVVYDDAPDGPHAVPVNGVGLGKGVLVLSNNSWAFGGHPVGQSSGPGVIYVYNSGTEKINFSSIAISGPNASDFTITSNTCSPTLAPHRTCAATVVFTPSAPGAKYATLIFADDSATSTQSVSLTGDGSRP